MDRHAAVAHNDDVWVFGGDRGWVLNDKLWKFNLGAESWTEVPALDPPCPRRGHTAVKCEGRRSMVVFGGMVMTVAPHYDAAGRLVSDNVSVNDTWELPLESEPLTWFRRAPGPHAPPPRRGHAVALLESDADHPAPRMYVFGGYREQADGPGVWYRDLWRLDLDSCEWQSICCWGDVPSARVGHAMAKTTRRSIVLFGGGSCDGPDNSLYECQENGLWRRILPVGGAVPPSPRSYMTVAVVGTRLFLYGGCANNQELETMFSVSLDFKTLFPRSLLSLVAEYVVLRNIPYRPRIQPDTAASDDPLCPPQALSPR